MQRTRKHPITKATGSVGDPAFQEAVLLDVAASVDVIYSLLEDLSERLRRVESRLR